MNEPGAAQCTTQSNPWNKPLLTQSHETAEAFYITTEQICYVAILYTDANWHCVGQGFARFADGEKVGFTLDGNKDPNVRDKCIRASQQLAYIYQGTLQHGVIDARGNFWPEETLDKNSYSTKQTQ